MATCWPDQIRSSGGGANAILARSDRVVLHRTRRLCRLPERRWAHAVRLACGIWVANVQASAGSEAAARRDARLTAATTLDWAGGEALVLAGDFNLGRPRLERLGHVAGREGDHIFASPALATAGPAQVLERGRLSDHSPLAATLELRVRPGPAPEAAEGGRSDIS